jgi:hypothetical protein
MPTAYETIERKMVMNVFHSSAGHRPIVVMTSDWRRVAIRSTLITELARKPV